MNRKEETRIERYEVQAFDWGFAGFHAIYVDGKCENCHKVTRISINERLAKQALDQHLRSFSTRQ